jgi:hypothetical protein
MKIKFDFFNQDNHDVLIINIKNKYCKDIIYYISKKYNKKISNINIYENNNKINLHFNKWVVDKKYIITINQNYINIIIKLKNKQIKLPQLNINTKIIDIKNILSFKDDIFLRYDKLDNNKTLKYYNIEDNIILSDSILSDSILSDTILSDSILSDTN